MHSGALRRMRTFFGAGFGRVDDVYLRGQPLASSGNVKGSFGSRRSLWQRLQPHFAQDALHSLRSAIFRRGGEGGAVGGVRELRMGRRWHPVNKTARQRHHHGLWRNSKERTAPCSTRDGNLLEAWAHVL